MFANRCRLILSIAVLITAATLCAQEFRGTIAGKVTDPQGAAIPGAKIVVTETRTGTRSSAVSEATGEYTVPFLALGEYEVSTTADGFRRYVRQGVTISAGEQVRLDVSLELGASSESVTVSADVPMLVTSNASLGQVVTTQEVELFPVNGRTPMMLNNLALGVISTFEPGPVRPFDNGAPNSVSLGGAPSGTSEVLLNGSPNAGFAGAMAYSPPQDAVMEVKVSIFESDAAYGHSGGGNTNLITKSGTNGIHGAASEFNQVSALDANSFFSNRNGVKRPAYNYNQYGIAAGGPVWLPKIYNGKNKLFWFFAFEGLRDADPANSPLETGSPVNFATVPTAAERNGDFSQLLKGGPQYQIYDPTTGVLNGTTITRQPFPNNIIPADRINPISKALLNLFPQPNTAGDVTGFRNYVVNAIDKDTYDNELGRLDYNLSDSNKVAFDFHHNYRAQDKNNYFGNQATGTYLYRINWGSSLDDVWTISPTLYADVRANWTRYNENRGMPNDGFDLTSLGFPASLASSSVATQLPYIVFNSCSVSNGSSNYFQCLSGNGDGTNAFDSFQIFGTLVKVRNNHTFKVGLDLREYRWSIFTHGNSAGTYTFNSSFTNGPTSSAAAAPYGQEFAAFLLGLPSSGSFDVNGQSTLKSRYYSFFFQDDWRVRSNLTLNLGLRFERETPTTERYNRAIDGFSPTATNSATSAAQAAYAANPNPLLPPSAFNPLGGVTYASSSNPNIYSTPAGNFSPRIGVAWQPKALGHGTVLRAGFGIFISPLELLGSGSTSSTVTAPQPGFSQTTQYVATSNNYLTSAGSLSNPFPNGILQPVGSSLGASAFLGQAITFYSPNPQNPYSIRWDFSIQRELPGAMVLELAYIGNHAVHLPIAATQLDYVPRQYLSTSPGRDNTTINLLTGTVPNPFKGLLPNSSSLNGSTVALQQLLIPYPQFPVGSGSSNGVIELQNPAGESYFESLNVRLQKRFTHGLTLINNFIWSKLIERTAYLNDSDPAPEKRIGTDSRPLREVLGVTYLLPIGKGRGLDFHHRWANTIAGGWNVNGVMTFQSGPVITFGNLIYYGGPLNLNPHQPNGPAFDITQFNTISAQQPASNIRTLGSQFNNLRRDPTKNLDLSLAKRFAIAERSYFELRGESFNTTNRVGFGAPSTTATSSTFGTITTQANTPRRIQIGARLVW